MKENSGAERPGHVAGELGRNSGEVELAAELAMRPHRCSATGMEWTSRRSSRRAGLAGGGEKSSSDAAVPRRSSPRRNGEGRERWGGEMRTAGARGGVVASK